MEVTFDIREDIVEHLRNEADRCGETMSALVESALRMALPQGNPPKTEAVLTSVKPANEALPPLPTWKADFLVDVSNKEELYRVLDGAENSLLRRLHGFQPDCAPEETEPLP